MRVDSGNRSGRRGIAWLLGGLGLLLVAPATPAFGEELEVRSQAGAASDEGDHLRGHLDLSSTWALDDQVGQTLALSDLRLVADATRLGARSLGFHVDLRARRSWNQLAEDRLTVRDAYLRLGGDRAAWHLDVGRQVVRTIGSAEVDGLRLERRLATHSSATVFGGFVPHPITGAFDPDFTGVGAGYEHRTRVQNHAGGVVASWYAGELDRVYVTQRSYLRVGRSLNLSTFGIVDLVPRETDRSVDLTSLLAMIQYRPRRWLDSSVTASHHHTVLPGKWWNDWLNERRRAVGFVLDGVDPVGTRITSVRWTNSVRVGPALTPYLRLRYDWRHTDRVRGYEGRSGVKWRRRLAFADLSYAYRDYFGNKNHLGGLELGRDANGWGVETGLLVLRSSPTGGGETQTRYDAHAAVWLELGQLFGGSRGVHLMMQYQGLFEPESNLHCLFAQVGYRL